MIGANDDLEKIPKQFISVAELLELFANCEQMSLERSAQWFLNNVQILNRTKKLILKNSYTLIEYEYNDSNFYICPIETIRLIALGEDCELSSEYVGFARRRILIDLKGIGLDINDDLIRNSPIYISELCHEDDDNFYKNQCKDLKNELNALKAIRIQKPQKLSDIHRYAVYLNKGNPLYFQDLELLARIHHELNVMEAYKGRSNKDDRIKDFLKDHGAEYGYSDPKPFHIKKISSFINIIKDQKSISSILNDLEKS